MNMMKVFRLISILTLALSLVGFITPPAIDQPLPPVLPSKMGPGKTDFPENFNPLTGLPVQDPTLLKLPSVSVSISNFPGATRPQVGLSLADQIYEFWIGVGMTRFLSIFHGRLPSFKPAMVGDCAVRWEPFNGTGIIVGNLIWYDENQNGTQDIGETGVPGVCVKLFDAVSQNLIASTTSDSNGYYGFSVEKGKSVFLSFDAPLGVEFSPLPAGGGRTDSAVDPNTGKTNTITASTNHFDEDAGLIWKESSPPESTNSNIQSIVWFDENHNGILDSEENGVAGIQLNLYDAQSGTLLATSRTDSEGHYQFSLESGKQYSLRVLPNLGAAFVASPKYQPKNTKIVNRYNDPISGVSPIFTLETFDSLDWKIAIRRPQVGPLRSGRIVFQHIVDYFRGGRLFYASKDEGVDIGGFGNVYEETPNSISTAFLDVNRILDTIKSSDGAGEDLYYGSYVFSQGPPENGKTAQGLTYFVNVLNASQYRYDPLSETYLRYDDHSDGRGNLYPSVDRSTGRQLQFANLVALFTEHVQIEGLKIEMNIVPNNKNRAVLFRDGKAYDVFWSTLNEDYEKSTQRLRPPRIVDTSGNFFPLKPGATWYMVVTTQSILSEQSSGMWRLRFYEPDIVGNFLKAP